MEKTIFSQQDQVEQQDVFIAKQEFYEEQAVLDTDADNVPLEGELLEAQFEQSVQPPPRWWKRALIGTALLFFTATVAQSVQWLVDTWQQNQWIYFAFSLVLCLAVLLGISAIIGEWRRLVKLKKRLNLQEQSQRLIGESAVKNHQVFSEQDSEKGRALCLSIADTLKLDSQHPAIVQWEKQLNESYSAREVTHLFSQTVLQSFDKKAKKLITKMAAESAVIVAISPLAIIDMFFIAWRNIRLINKIAAIYGIELGYFTRLRLLRMVLVNLAFAGATEIVQDLGMDWLSQDITAKLSARAAQGIGVGLLTARLGIKAMEFCRPLAFEKAEKPKLSHVQKELLTVMKDTVLGKNKVKEKEEV